MVVMGKYPVSYGDPKRGIFRNVEGRSRQGIGKRPQGNAACVTVDKALSQRNSFMRAG